MLISVYLVSYLARVDSIHVRYMVARRKLYGANYGSKLCAVINLGSLEVKTIQNIHEHYVLGWSMCLHARRCKCSLWRLSILHHITEYHLLSSEIICRTFPPWLLSRKDGVEKKIQIQLAPWDTCVVMYNSIISTTLHSSCGCLADLPLDDTGVSCNTRIFTEFKSLWTRLQHLVFVTEEAILCKISKLMPCSSLLLSLYLLLVQLLVVTIRDKCSLAWCGVALVSGHNLTRCHWDCVMDTEHGLFPPKHISLLWNFSEQNMVCYHLNISAFFETYQNRTWSVTT